MIKVRLILRPRPPETDKPVRSEDLAAVQAAAQAVLPTNTATEVDEGHENERFVPDEQLETRLHEHVGAQLDEKHELLKRRAENAGHTVDGQRELEELSDQIQADASQRNAREQAKARDAFEKMIGEIAKIMTVEGSKEMFRVIIRELAEAFF